MFWPQNFPRYLDLLASSSMARWTAYGVRETLNLLLPTTCAICERVDSRLCAPCRHQIQQQLLLPPVGENLQFYVELPSLQRQIPISASGIYANELARAILAFKNQQRYFLGAEFCVYLAALINVGCPPRLLNQPTLVVPLPSSLRSLGKRGYSPVQTMLDCAQSRGLLGARMQVSQVLHYRLTHVLGGAQKTKSGYARRSGNTHFVAEIAINQKQPVILVDDVLTTGSTMRNAALACIDAGYEVIGGVVLAYTQPPSE